jgi:hypothetical protein
MGAFSVEAKGRRRVYRSSLGTIYKVAGLLLIVVVHVILVVNLVIWSASGETTISWVGVRDLLGGYVLVCLLGLWFINLFPVVRLEEEGIMVSYNLFWSVFVSWGDIVAIKAVFPERFVTLVLTKRLTRLHYIYGSAAGEFTPAFFIADDTRGRELLLRHIKTASGISG